MDRDRIGEAFAVLLAFCVVAGFVRAQTQAPRPLPAPLQQSLERPGGAATVLLLFPEWCAQCRKMMRPLSDFLIRNNTENIHAYGLLALNEEETTTDPFKDNFKDPLHTPILTTPSTTLQNFGAVNFPFIVMTDNAGRVRFIGTVAQTRSTQAVSWSRSLTGTYAKPRRGSRDCRADDEKPARENNADQPKLSCTSST